MAGAVPFPLPLRSDPGPVKFMGEPSLVNVFPEMIGEDKKKPVGLLSIPGQTEFASVTDVPSRAMLFVDEEDLGYSLHGSTLYRAAEDGTSTALDGIVAGSKPALMERGAERFMNSEVTITVASPAVVRWVDHRLAAGTPFQFTTDGALPDGVEENTTYYVLAAGLADNTFRFSTTAGGSAINATGTQSGTHIATRTEKTYQIVVVSDAGAYCVEDGHIWRIAMPEDAGVPNSATFLNGLWVFGFPSGRFYPSELNDARSINAIAYSNAEARPDGLERAFADHGELLLFGKRTVEIFTASDDPDEPFVPLSGAFISKGCASKHTVASFDNAAHWLADDGIVYRVGDGYSATRVSTHAVERDIARLGDKTTIRAYVDIAKGHSFYVLTCSFWTWALDAATGQWCQRKSHQRETWTAWPYMSAWGKRLVGSTQSGKILELSDDVYHENGKAIRRELILPDIPGPVSFDYLELEVATGVGLDVAAGEKGYDPKIMLSWSDDGGHTWSPELMISVGKLGQYATRVRFDGLGSVDEHRGRRFRIAYTERTISGFLLTDIAAEALAA